MTLLVILCILTSFSANFIFYNVFKQHHRDRFSLWLRLENEITDSETLRQTVAYNTLQAESAISSGGLSGKGFLEGTLTKGNFVPEQHTDYIFTTLGEEWGLYGTFTVTLLFAFLCLRIWYLAENQKSKFYRIYGYRYNAYHRNSASFLQLRRFRFMGIYHVIIYLLEIEYGQRKALIFSIFS